MTNGVSHLSPTEKSANHIKCGQIKILDERGDKGTIEQCVEKQIVKLSAEERHRCAALIALTLHSMLLKIRWLSVHLLCFAICKRRVE